MAARKPKPPKSQSGPSGGFDGFDLTEVRERQPPVWQQPSSEQPQWGMQQQPQWQPAPHDRRSPWGWVLLVAAIIALVVVVLLV